MSFASMHNDYLDPDRYFQEEPPCARCIHDDPKNECCKLNECKFEEKNKVEMHTPFPWQIESTSFQYGKPIAWYVSGGINRHEDGPERTVCRVSTCKEDAELIANIPKLIEALQRIASSNASLHGTTSMMLSRCIQIANEALGKS